MMLKQAFTKWQRGSRGEFLFYNQRLCGHQQVTGETSLAEKQSGVSGFELR